MATAKPLFRPAYLLVGLPIPVLAVLKMLGVLPVATWSWWVIWAPLWGPWVMLVATLGIALLVAAWESFFAKPSH